MIFEKIKKFIKNLGSREIFLALCFVMIYFFALCAPTDPDMGWHLMDGKYLMEHHFQPAKTDIFSYSMPDFPLIMHEWLTDILMYNLYTHAGLFALSIFFAFVTTAAFVVATLGVEGKIEYKFVAALVGIIASQPILGVKAQMFSLLGLATVVFVILNFRRNQQSKLIYYLPLLFFIWVNLHGGFPVGLFFIGVFLALEYFKNGLLAVFLKFKKWNFFEKASGWLQKNSLSLKSALKLNLLFILSCVATLVNPYGWRIYIEIVTTIFDKYAKSFIAEWFPVSAMNPTSSQFILYIFFLAVLLIISFRKSDFTYVAVAAVFLYLSFSSWRHLPLFMIVSIPLWVLIVEFLAGKELSVVLNKKWFLACFLVATIVIPYQRMKLVPADYSIERIAEKGNYPAEAVKFLKANPKPGNIFNEYNWGGYLIWQYPEKKLYIDGRMPSWRHKGFSVLEEFNNTFKSGEGLVATIEKYGITQALVYNNVPNQMSFRSLKWELAYEDSLALVFSRPEEK